MPLTYPEKDAAPADFGTYWLAVAEDEYTAKRFDASTAAAQIASAHLQRAALRPTITLDALGILAPAGTELNTAGVRA